MKGLLLPLIAAICVSITVKAQLNYSSFLSENIAGTYADLDTNGTVIATANKDDATSAAQNIGFTFDFNGQSFTQFRLNTNGFIKLGTTAPSTNALFFGGGAVYTGGVFNSTNSSDQNLLVPFNHDLEAGGSSCEYRVHTSGVSGSRVCTIQYKNVKDKTTSPLNQFDSINFQIKLYESTNIIEFILGNWYASSDSSRFKSAACGIKGSTGATTNQLVVVTKGSTQIYSDATFINGNYTGNAFNFGNGNVGNGTGPGGSRPMPDVGRTYRFTPAFVLDVAIDLAICQGELAIPWGLPHDYKARLTNVGINQATGFWVYMDITGANTYKDSVFYNVLSVGAPQIVNFGAYAPINLGVNDIHIYAQPDSNNANNSIHYRQEVSRDKYSHVDTSIASSGIVGYNAGAGGMILHRYHVTGKRRIVETGMLVSDEPANIGQTVYGVVTNSTGTLVARSADYVIQSADLGTWKNFRIDRHANNVMDTIRSPLISNADFYAGVYLTGGGVRYTAVAHEAESPLRANTFYYHGGALTAYPATLEYRSYLRAVARGNSLKMENITLNDPSCPDSVKTIQVTLTNKDTIAADFSVYPLELMVSSTGPVNQTMRNTINSGVILPDSSATFTITNNFNIGQQGIYNIEISALTEIEIDTMDNFKNYNINVVVTPGVTLTVTPDSVICNGTPFTFVAIPYTAGSILYQWNINDVNSGSPTTDSSFTPTLNWGDTVSVDMITDHCTTSVFTVSSNEIMMKLNPKPTPISGKFANDTVVQFTNKNYAAALKPGSQYLWSVNGGVIAGDSTKSAVSVNWDTANVNGSISLIETDAQNCSRFNTRKVIIINITGIEKVINSLGLGEIFPNPTGGNLSIPLYSNGTQKIEVHLLDITGKRLEQLYTGDLSGKQNLQVNLESHQNGLYLVEVKSESGQRELKKVSILH
ncbi:MAG: T9SS type A sorting domain-containing protein [Vicingaceae bacterium]